MELVRSQQALGSGAFLLARRSSHPQRVARAERTRGTVRSALRALPTHPREIDSERPKNVTGHR